MAKAWHKKHISTKWGVVIIVVLLLGVVVAISQLGNTQNIFSHASQKFEDGGSSGTQNWSKIRKQEREDAEKHYATYLEEFCAKGETPVDIYIWCENDRTAAATYKNANDQECRKKGASVRILVSKKDVTTGSYVNGHFVIRYYYGCPQFQTPNSKQYNL